MTEPGAPPPDWDAVFHGARRRVLGRLLVVAAIGAAGAIFLLGGGLSAQGTVHWRPILGLPSSAESKSTASKKHKRHNGKPRHEKHDGGNDSGGPQNDHRGHHRKKKPPPPKHHHHHHHAQWNPCAGDAAGTEYCEAVEEPTTTGEPTTTTTTGEPEAAAGR